MKLIIGNYRYSSWSLRAWLALQHSGLLHETSRILLFKDQYKEKILSYSAAGQVPILTDGDVTVWESLAIIDYLARKAPSKYWWPQDDAAWAHARSIAMEMHSGFAALREHLPMDLLSQRKNVDWPDDVKKDIQRIDDIWQETRERFGSKETENPGPFLFGAFSAADMMFAPVATRFITHGIRPSNPSRAYMASISSHKTMDEWYRAAQLEKESFPFIQALFDK